MLVGDPRRERPIGVGVELEPGGHEHLLLDLEVLATLRLPEVEQLPGGLRSILGTSQSLGDDERMVMIVGQQRQRGAALHRPGAAATWSGALRGSPTGSKTAWRAPLTPNS